jgi:outer membrane lipoprotein LolB
MNLLNFSVCVPRWRGRVQWLRLVGAGTLLLLAACTTVPPPAPSGPTGPAWEVRAAQLPASEWTAEGRFAVAVSGRQGRGEQGGQGTFRWHRSAAGSVVEVSGPLGLGRVTVFLDERGARFEQGDRQWQTVDLAGELRQRFGFSLPVRGLDYWLRGLPAPSPATTPVAGTVGFEQDGWTVEYPAFDAAARPLRLTASRPGMRVRAVVERWQEAAPTPVPTP